MVGGQKKAISDRAWGAPFFTPRDDTVSHTFPHILTHSHLLIPSHTILYFYLLLHLPFVPSLPLLTLYMLPFVSFVVVVMIVGFGTVVAIGICLFFLFLSFFPFVPSPNTTTQHTHALMIMKGFTSSTTAKRSLTMIANRACFGAGCYWGNNTLITYTLHALLSDIPSDKSDLINILLSVPTNLSHHTLIIPCDSD